jgi:hypothetical protein
MTAEIAFDRIADLVRTTNNGKLLLTNIPRELRRFVPELKAEGLLIPACFIRTSDAVRL